MSENSLQPDAHHCPDEPVAEKAMWQGWMILVLLAGVILPLTALAAEISWRICSSIFFDPIPTTWHIMLFSIIPLATILVLYVHRTRSTRLTFIISLLVGASLGTALVYSITFLPIAPFSMLTIAIGIGFLGLSPFFAFASAIACNRNFMKLPHVDKRRHIRIMRAGFAIVALIAGGYMITSWATDIGVKMAASDEEAKSARGIKMLRLVRNDSTLLRACYNLPASSLLVWGAWWGPDTSVARNEARSIYYRVTGESFNSVPPPRLVGFREDWAWDNFADSDVGGTAVNSVDRSLSLTSSRIDTVVEPDELVAYTEWTMVFENRSMTAGEARAEIALPPGSAVSRLTLWINGEEREAAFSTRGKVSQAYQEIAVVQRRDPVLVTTCGPDRVLMQCFPVPPEGGIMKVRIGITSPLLLEEQSQGSLVLPRVVERNFGISDNVAHSILIESPKEISYHGVDGISPIAMGSKSIINTTFSDARFSRSANVIRCERDPHVQQVWTPDRLQPDRYAVVQSIVESTVERPANLIIVIDGSQWLKKVKGEIARALEELPEGVQVSVILASEPAQELLPLTPLPSEKIRSVSREVGNARFAGGIDNRPGLLQAWDIALQHGGGTILWIHGPQPLTSDGRAEQIIQRWERFPGAVQLYSIGAANGRNSILADLERTGIVHAVRRDGDLRSDLVRLFGAWKGSETRFITVRERVPLSDIGDGVRASGHIARLWALDEVIRICRKADSRLLGEAAELAAQHQLVTPVSGAVVLETQEQYDRAGLEPVDPSTVPSVIPEPATWMALSMGMAVLGGSVYRGRRRRK